MKGTRSRQLPPEGRRRICLKSMTGLRNARSVSSPLWRSLSKLLIKKRGGIAPLRINRGPRASDLGIEEFRRHVGRRSIRPGTRGHMGNQAQAAANRWQCSIDASLRAMAANVVAQHPEVRLQVRRLRIPLGVIAAERMREHQHGPVVIPVNAVVVA